MTVLDTNVISEFGRQEPDKVVLTRLRGFRDERYITAINEAEILSGLEPLPHGRKAMALRLEVELMLEVDFAGKVLPFDSAAAKAYAIIGAARRAAGRPISVFDAQIAAIVRARKATLVTRNARDFEGCGFEVINPCA
jgi:predicted nucleic acid-binding protein